MSFSLALIGVAILVTFVRNPPRVAVVDGARCSWRDTLTRLAGERPFQFVSLFAAILGFVTIADSLVYLTLQRRTNLPLEWLPLMYVATHAAFGVFALPFSWMADRAGRGVVVVGGYVALLCLYGVLLAPSFGAATLVASVVLLGAHYAATDGLLPALASGILPETARATGLSLLATFQDVGRLLASVAFGWVWTRGSMDAAVIVFAIALGAALLTLASRLICLGADQA